MRPGDSVLLLTGAHSHLAICETGSVTDTLPCFGKATGMSGLALVPRATLSRARGLTLASRPTRAGLRSRRWLAPGLGKEGALV
jgi:hypothetical protein